MFPLGSFPLYKRYTIPYKITAEEDERLYLFRELSEEEMQLAHETGLACQKAERVSALEKMKQIEAVFGVRLWDEEDELTADAEQDEEPAGSASERPEEDLPLYVAVFSHSKKLFAVLGTREQAYHSMVRLACCVKGVRFTRTDLVFDLWAKIENPFHFKVGQACLNISDAQGAAVKLVQEKHVTGGKKIKQKKYRVSLSIPIRTLSDYSAGEGSLVHLEGNSCKVSVQVDGTNATYNITQKISGETRFGICHNSREVFVPVASAYDQDMALHVRRNRSGNFVVFKRHMYPVEYTRWFRFMESALISAILFHVGRLLNHIPHRKKVALFFEKYAEKAEEGTFELCRRCASSKRTRCYFVIDETAPDYQRVKDDPCVVKKYSLKYYWLFYNINYFISPEAPIHIHLLNANNRYVRWTCIRHPFIFLQHGITYMKRQGAHSTYLKDHAGEASYVVVSSEKEKWVVADSFQLSPERIFKTGMLMFDNCAYKHMNQASPDKITIMLTWKPYEESLDNYEDSTYYRYTLQAYNMLLRYVDRSQINIVAHPRAYDLLMTTDLRDLVWTKPISEVLKESKLLITDYSSVCWNSFYQGGGVVFFQPDLKEYEEYTGPLIPKDNEYIGHRVFNVEELEQVVSGGITDGTIRLDHFRNEEFERRYNEINEFHDGKNTERVYKVLKEKKFI